MILATRAVLLLALALALVFALTLTARTAGAEPERAGRTSALSWVRLPGAEGCIGAPALAAAVEAYLHRRVFVPPADAEISVEATVAYRPDTRRFKATFRVADRAGVVLGVRDVEESVASCSKLDDRFAFVLSVLVDPDAALGAAPDEPAAALPAPVAVVPIAAQRTKPETPRPLPPRPEPWRWLLGAELGGAAGLVPDIGLVLSVGVLVTPPRWPAFHARGSSYLPTRRRIEGSAFADIGLVTGEVGICPFQLRPAPFGVTFCVDGLLGQLSARGEGFPDSRAYATLLGGVVLDVVAEIAVTRVVALTLSPSLIVPLTRARLAYDDAASARHTIFDVSSIGGSLALGIAIGSR